MTTKEMTIEEMQRHMDALPILIKHLKGCVGGARALKQWDEARLPKPEPKVTPWTFETVPKDLVKVVRRGNQRVCTVMFIEIEGVIVGLGRESSLIPWDGLCFEWNQLDGSPCGQVVEES